MNHWHLLNNWFVIYITPDLQMLKPSVIKKEKKAIIKHGIDDLIRVKDL